MLIAMEYSNDILRFEEKILFKLRTLYSEFGYKQYRMSRFEEYELYAGNKAFMPSGDILTFTGVGGKLMALRPDVTLSIVKYTKDDEELKKLYYNENIYRSDGIEFQEQMQVGLECIGEIDVKLTGEVLMLAKRSLEVVSERSRLDISHMGFLNGLLQCEITSIEQRNEIVSCISERNTSGIKTLCAEHDFSNDFCMNLITLASLYGEYDDVINELQKLCENDEMNDALKELAELDRELKVHGITQGVNIDFSVVNDISYYNGIIFQGYIEGVPTRVLSGGRYDELLRKFGRHSGAIGFAVYLDMLEEHDTAETDTGSKMINIALPKGRLGEKAYSIFEASGYSCPEILEKSRKLVFENPEAGVRYFWVKPSDVSIYVERGVADIGVVGKDILLESTPEVYELLDLGIGKCNISVAAEKGFTPGCHEKTLRVATKFPNIARRYYQKQGRGIDVIELNGSIELAPLLGLSDVIVDIVETGQTLLENNMESMELIIEVSARLIANKSSYKFNYEKIVNLCSAVSQDRGHNNIGNNERD